jgi:hypothetical protein
MSKLRLVGCRRVTVVAAGFMGLALAEAAIAIDLRDWGRKFPASERFVVLSQFDNEAVLDKETQLVWQRTPSSGTAIWHGAFNGCLQLTLGGRLGWRLPSVPEYLSLLVQADPPPARPTLPSGHPFMNVQSGVYWAATLPPNPSGQPVTSAFVVSFVSGPLYFAPIDTHRHRWCVRGGGVLGE